MSRRRTQEKAYRRAVLVRSIDEAIQRVEQRARIATWTIATREQLADPSLLRALIDSELARMLAEPVRD